MSKQSFTINFAPPVHARNHLVESFNHGFRYALLDDKYRTLHVPANCKDYIQDMVWSETKKRPATIYGFTWTPGAIDITRPRQVLGIQFPDEFQPKSNLPWQSFLNFFSDELGYPKTSLQLTNAGRAALILYPNQWYHSPVMTSMFTSLIRLGSNYLGEQKPLEFLDLLAYSRATQVVMQHCLPDVQRLKATLPRIKIIIAGRLPNQTYREYSDVGYTHSNGIYGWDGFAKNQWWVA